MTRQPIWQLVANLGDVNPYDYGGFFIFKDKTGVYDLEAVIIQTSEENENEIFCGRILMEKCYLTNGVLSDNKFNLDSEVWFSKDLDSVCSFADMTREDMIAYLTSDDPIERGWSYQALSSYFGSDNFGGDGLQLVERKEVIKQYSRHWKNYHRRNKN